MNSHPRVPWLTLLLVLANLGLAVSVTLGGGELAREYGFKVAEPSFRDAFASIFLHWNLLHLLANMVFLAAAGAAVEQALGSVRFGALYILSGLAGVAVHWAMFRGASDPAPLVGASGAVAGCLGYTAVRYGTVRVSLGKALGIPLWGFIFLWFALQVAGMMVKIGDGPSGVSFGAHLGGLALGILFSLLLGAPQAADLEQSRQTMQDLSDRGPAASLASAKQVLEKNPSDLTALRQAAEAARTLGNGEEEASFQLALVSRDPESALNRLADLGQLSKLPVIERLKLAGQVSSPLRFKLLHSVAMQVDEPERPNALLELAMMDAKGPWAGLLTQEFPMHPATELGRRKGVVS